jgi:hypothetical protein
MLFVHCLSKPWNNLNEQEKEQVEGKDRREEEPPDGLCKQNGGGGELITESPQVMTFLQ